MIEIRRQSYWEEALRLYIDRVTDEPFKWGEHDCALYAAGAVKAMTGVDPAEQYRGTYTNATGAKEALRTHGAGTLLREVKAWFGEPKSIALAHRGDLVMKDRNSIGVCVGQFSWFVGEEGSHRGLVWFPTRDCAYAFTVPY